MIMHMNIYTGTNETCPYYVNVERAILCITNSLTYQLNGGGDDVKGCWRVTFMIYPHSPLPNHPSPPPVQTSN